MLSRHEKYLSVLTLEINYRVTTEVLFLKRIILKPLKDENMVITTNFGFESQLCKGKVLAPPNIYCTQREPSN